MINLLSEFLHYLNLSCMWPVNCVCAYGGVMLLHAQYLGARGAGRSLPGGDTPGASPPLAARNTVGQWDWALTGIG